MASVVAAIVIVFCTIVIYFGIKIFRENRKMAAKQKEMLEENEHPLRGRNL